MKQQPGYYILPKPTKSFWDSLLFVIKIPISLPGWIVSFLLARIITNIILNPTQAKSQRPVHLVHLTDSPHGENNIVIVNLLPKPWYKTLADFLLKFSSTFFRLPFLAAIKQKQLRYDNADDKAHIDKLIYDIGLLSQGDATDNDCVGIVCDWEKIHVKGIEHLDDELRAYFFQQLQEQYGADVLKPRTTNIEFFTLESPDDAVLDSIAVSAQNEDSKAMSERKFVIVCLAHGQSYVDWIKRFHYSAEKIGCTVVGFNYRGIDYSKGLVWTENNMIDDAISQVERLLALGAKPENIGLEGMCVGGSIATLAAARLHERDLKVKLYNERSFRSTARFLAGSVLSDAPSSLLSPVTWLRYSLVIFVYVVLAPVIWLAGWHLDAASAWDKIPFADKSYSVIRNAMDENPNAPKHDGIIEDSWSSMASLVDETRASLVDKKQLGQSLTPEETMQLADTPDKHHFKVDPQFALENKKPHVIASRHLVLANSDIPLRMSDHMVASFKDKFFQSPIASSSDEPNRSRSTADVLPI